VIVVGWIEQVGGGFRVRRRCQGKIVTDSTHATRAAAAVRLAQLTAASQRLSRNLSGTPAPTLRDWVDRWLPAHTAGTATLAKYESMLRVHILPRFGRHRLDEISRNDIKAFAVDLRTHVAAVTARSIISVLGLVLREAIEEHYLYFDPTHRLRLRDGVVVPRPVATAEQVLRMAERMPNRITRTLVITAAYTGMRIGELLALTRHHVHLDQAQLTVVPDQGALHEVSGQRWLGPPKTPASARTIALPPFLVDGLQLLHDSHPFETMFCNQTGSWLWRTTLVERHWRPACDGHPGRGWPPIMTGFRFHDLRHTHRTWMDEDNIPEPLKSARMGHRMPGIGAIDSHVTEAMLPRLLTALQRRWQRSEGRW
jgi:integrase